MFLRQSVVLLLSLSIFGHRLAKILRRGNSQMKKFNYTFWFNGIIGNILPVATLNSAAILAHIYKKHV
jgi:predicted membrane channel-forming protein YqfA (hemolysin III family)